MAKKRTSRKKAPHPAKTQQDSEIRQARRAVSAASGGQAQALSVSGGKTASGADQKKLTSTASAGTSTDSAQRSSAASPGESSVAGVGGVMKGLLRAAAGLVAGNAKPQPQDAKFAATDQSLSSLPCNPLTGLARRHVGRIGRAPADDSAQLDQHSDRVLAKLARARLGAWLDESESERTTSINPLNRQTDSD